MITDQTGYQIDLTISHFAGSPSFRVHRKTKRLTTQRCRPSEFPRPSRLAVECIVCACHLCKAGAPEHGPAWARAEEQALVLGFLYIPAPLLCLWPIDPFLLKHNTRDPFPDHGHHCSDLYIRRSTDFYQGWPFFHRFIPYITANTVVYPQHSKAKPSNL